MKNASHHSHCLNCGTPLAGPFCAQCGQHDVDYSGSFWHVVEESLEGLLHFDGKFLKSLRYIFTRPGFLTQEFNAGRRVRYTNPLRFYFFASFLFFATGALAPQLTTTPSAPAVSKQAAPAPAGGAKAGPVGAEGADKALVTEKKWGLNFTIGSGNTDGYISRLVRDNFPLDEQGQKSVVSESTHFLPVALFLGVPILALLLKLAYLGSGRTYIEHLIFGLHVQAFVFMAVLVAKGLLLATARAGDTAQAAVQGVATLASLWVVFRALRVVYGQGRWITGLKLALVVIVYELLLMVGMLALLIATAVALHHAG